MPSDAIDIPKSKSRTADNVVTLTKTPPTNFSPADQRFKSSSLGLPAIRQPKVLHPVEKDAIRVLLLENISQDAVRTFREKGFQVDHYTTAMSADELVAKIGDYHAIGIRSKTKITEHVLKAASKACALQV